VFLDEAVVAGAGAFEITTSQNLMSQTKKSIKGKSKLGVIAYSQALLSIPKALALNGGFDIQEVVINLQHEQDKGNTVGLNIETGEPIDVSRSKIFDNYRVKKQILTSAGGLAAQLLLVDEIIYMKENYTT